LDSANRVRVIFFFIVVGTGLLLLVPGVLEVLFPFGTDVFRLLDCVAFLVSLVDLVWGLIFPKLWAEFFSDIEGVGERVEVGTVTHVRCSFCGFEFRRAWIRGDFVGKVDKECRLCHCSFKVKAIYAVDLKPRGSQRGKESGF
jgi:hypothetical protein